MDPSLAEFRDALSTGRCIFVIGTGVSSATAQDPRASWAGLCASGIDYAASTRPLPEGWPEAQRAALESARTAEDLMQLASVVVSGLGGPASADYSSWLRRDVGYLEPKNPELIEVISSFGLPIATTNYDELIERITGRGSVTWQEVAQFQRAISGQSSDIAHLHGFWKRPESVVFTADQYDLMLADTKAETLRQSMAAVNSLIFVGFGEGLSDPNFSSLRNWISETLEFQEIRHFRLCLQGQRDALMREEESQHGRVLPIAYGAEHSDLEPFLGSLRSAVPEHINGLATTKNALTILEEEVRESAVLSPHVRDPDSATVADLLVPPVLLPMAYSQYVASLREDRDVRPVRCDLAVEVARPRLIVAGEEHVGVSSALLWLAARQAVDREDLIPVKVDFRKIGAGLGPLRREVIKQLRSTGRWYRKQDQLPDIALVLDNVHNASAIRLERVIAELAEPQYVRAILGCRIGNEVSLVENLTAAKQEFVVRYVGRMSKADVEGLAKLVAPHARAEQLSKSAVAVVRTHSLPSTPFTLSMILSAILRGEALMAATSPTALLDAYLDLLLGRGTLEDDSRLGMDSFGRSYVLSKLAAEFVLERSGALSHVRVMDVLTRVFENLDWNESPVDVLRDLQDRRVLLIRAGEVSFSQTSYLHLFAAKRAQLENAFLEHLKNDPVYYAPILSHYAALKRTDADLLAALLPLLEKFSNLAPPVASVFAIDVPARDDAQRDGRSYEERLAEEVANAPRSDDPEDLDPLDERDEDDHVPFPLEPVGEEPTLWLHMLTLDLLSKVLRDTEVIEDHDFKKGALVDILQAWTGLVSRIEIEGSERPDMTEVLETLADELHLPASKLKGFLEDFYHLLPLSIAMGGIRVTLASRKLVKTIRRALEDEELAADHAFSFLAFYILFDVRADGWADLLQEMLSRHGASDAVSVVLRRAVLFTYLRRDLEPNEERLVLDFLVDQTLRSEGLPRSAHERIRRQLESARLTADTRARVRTAPERELEI